MNQEERRELVKYRIIKARDTFNEVNLHIENKLWNTAVNRLYYACFYAVIAVLVDKESGKFYNDIFDLRQTGDYDDYIDFRKEDVLDLIGPANELISKIERILSTRFV
jgi:uncharacterized protein (UPF0332 family)